MLHQICGAKTRSLCWVSSHKIYRLVSDLWEMRIIHDYISKIISSSVTKTNATLTKGNNSKHRSNAITTIILRDFFSLIFFPNTNIKIICHLPTHVKRYIWTYPQSIYPRKSQLAIDQGAPKVIRRRYEPAVRNTARLRRATGDRLTNYSHLLQCPSELYRCSTLQMAAV